MPLTTTVPWYKRAIQSARKMTWPRFADMPLNLKIGAAPAFALLMLMFVSSVMLWSQMRQRAVLDTVLRYDDARSRLEADAQIITAANGSLFEILARQAAGGSARHSEAALQGVLAQVDSTQVDLRDLQPDLPPQDRFRFSVTLLDLANYRGAIQVLGSMLGVDFNAGADFIEPYTENYDHITLPLRQLSHDVDQQSAAIARTSRHQAAQTDAFLLAFILITTCIVFVVCGSIICATKRTIRQITDATVRLASGRNDFDLAALYRRDELGAIVESLTIFAQDQNRITTLRAEREALQTRQQEVQKLAECDELTGLLNRRAMIPLLERALTEIDTATIQACVAMLDLDHFKGINDDFGHLVGDEVLRYIARIFHETLFSSYTMARWGGEEFLFLLPNTSLVTATQCLEQLRIVVASLNFEHICHGLHVTLSCGVVELHPNDTLLSALTRADMAMYMAKHTGRDRVICETELPHKVEEEPELTQRRVIHFDIS